MKDQLAAVPHVCGGVQHEVLARNLQLCLQCREIFKPRDMGKFIPPLSAADRAYLRKIDESLERSRRHEQQ